MRELNFRAWVKKGEYMQEGGLMLYWLNGGLRADGPGVYLGNGWVEGHINREVGNMKDIEPDVVLMQLLDFKDIRGRSVYEGDIVEAGIHSDDKVIREVYIKDGCAVIDFKDTDADMFCLGNFPGYFRVIGNRFENPELLKEQT